MRSGRIQLANGHWELWDPSNSHLDSGSVLIQGRSNETCSYSHQVASIGAVGNVGCFRFRLGCLCFPFTSLPCLASPDNKRLLACVRPSKCREKQTEPFTQQARGSLEVSVAKERGLSQDVSLGC